MRNFNYTARDKTGAMIKGSLLAADRNVALAELKKQGMVPVAVVDGPGGRISMDGGWQRSISTRTLMVVCASLVLLGMGVAVWMADGARKKSETVSRKMERQIPKKTKVESNVKMPEKPPAPSVPEKVTQPGEEPKREVIVTNLPLSPKARVSRATTNTLAYIMTAKRGELDENGNIRKKFATGTEQVIHMMVNARLGNPPPPLPNLPVEESVNEILNRDIVVYENDSPETIQEKENVAAAKQALKEYIIQGGTPESFLTYYHNELAKVYNEWKEAQQQTTALMKEGRAEEAKRFADEKNANFVTRGIRNVLILQGRK